MMEKVPMTASGYAALEVELKQRQSVERPRIIEHIAEARSHGDLSENAEYHAAKEEQSHNEGRIAELEDKLARADIIDISKLSGDTVKFGATVTLVDEDTEKKTVWQIVGEPEADAKEGRISVSSPLARALIGAATDEPPDVIERRIALRRQRRRLLDPPDPPTFTVVLGEAVLHEQIGGPHVLAEQFSWVERWLGGATEGQAGREARSACPAAASRRRHQSCRSAGTP